MAEANCRVKRCPRCSTEKPVSEFHKDRTTADGLCTGCKECKRQQLECRRAVRGDELRKRDLELWHANPDRNRLRRERIQAAPQKHRDYQRDYRSADPEKWREYRANYYANNREKMLEYHRQWRKKRVAENPAYKLACRMRCRIAYAMNGRGQIKRSSTQEMIGCSWEFLRDFIAAKFQPGMSFENYGEWHVDHIIPLASAQDEAELIRLFHYKNLQPLWAEDNRKKGVSIPDVA